MGLNILITNNALAGRGGSELYVRDLAKQLIKRGHQPVAYSTRLGEVAKELRGLGVEVVDDLHQAPVVPDIIHGHHHMETLTALLHFSAAPAINFCHSSKLWLEAPLLFPRVRRYVAVDHACRDRLVHEHGIDEKRIAVLLNFVDLERFKPRLAPLPDRPRRALIFSNYANEQTHLPCVREACQRAGIELELAGAGVGRERSNMESMLQGYELVFAKARCALEALAVGSAVILCDAGGAGPMVTSREFDQLRPLNFGIRTLRNPLHPDFVLREIERYDANDATMVSQRVRTTAGHETVIDQLIDLYHEVIEEHRTLGEDAEAEGRAAAAYLRHLKIDFAAHGAASMRLRERLQGIPLLRGVGNKLVQMIIRERR